MNSVPSLNVASVRRITLGSASPSAALIRRRPGRVVAPTAAPVPAASISRTRRIVGDSRPTSAAAVIHPATTPPTITTSSGSSMVPTLAAAGR